MPISKPLALYHLEVSRVLLSSHATVIHGYVIHVLQFTGYKNIHLSGHEMVMTQVNVRTI